MSVACVIPAYKQPGLLAEALASVMAQTLPDARAVVVDDGCPMPETREVALEAAARHPGRVHVLRQRNGGLSAARNRGIEFVLSALPQARAVYMLDADNRIEPEFLARGLALLEASPAGTGWLYPDIDSFGGEDCSDCAGEFSRLSLLLDNYCEAGSLVRRGMLEAGLRYDETLRQGWEDVEFWLRCVEAGFTGRHWPDAGFRYRRRAESMLAESDRIVPQLRGAMLARHPALYHHRHLMALEAAEAPRHAVMVPGGGVRIVHDPAEAGAALDRPGWRRDLWAFWANPAASHQPYAMVFAEPALLDALARARLLHWVFWLGCLSLRQGERPMVGVVTAPGQEIGLRIDGGPLDEAAILFVRTQDVLRDIWRDETTRPTGHVRIGLDFPGAPPAPARALPAFEAERRAIALARADAPPRAWRRVWRVSQDAMAAHALGRQGLGMTLPRRPGGRAIGIVQPLHSRGGVERVLLQQAVVLRQAGWHPHLFVTQADRIELLPGMAEAYDSVNLLGITGREAWADAERPYFGAETSGFGHQPGAADALGALAGMDVFVNTHALAGHALAARLRRLGIRTVLGLHLTERGGFGEPLGQAHTALAYEHAYDMATVISGRLRAWCLAHGWPEDKLMLLRNAPGYATDAESIAAALAGRVPRPEGRLRAVYLGRLDAQKGLERLATTIAATADFVDWRVAGRPVLTGAPPALGVPVEPPAESAAELDAVFAWADIFYLPSRFEGVPLTILEAQRLGCLPLATDVGAVGEIIEHGVDGWLLAGQATDTAIVADAVAALRALDADRPRLARMAAAASARLAASRWEDTMRDWMDWLERVA